MERRGPSLLGAYLIGGVLFLGGCGDMGPGAEPRVETLDPPTFEAFTQSADPALALDPETGEVLLAWGGESQEEEWDLWFARSANGGDGFSDPVRVNDLPGDLYPHAEGAPRLVAARGALALFWNNRIEVEGRRFATSDMRFARSVDGGGSWSEAINLQDPLDPVQLPPRAHTFHGAGWDGDSILVVVWLDGRERDERRIERGVEEGMTREEAARTPEAFEDTQDPRDGDATVFAAVSHDLGATWEPENRRISGEACPCCRIGMVRTPSGELIASWRQHFDGSIRDPVMRPLLMEESAPPPLRLHEDGWEYPGCPHSGPGLDVDAHEVLHATWYTGAEGRRGVYYARKPPGANAFTAPVPVVSGEAVGVAHPAIAAFPDGRTVVAQNVDDEGRRVIVLAELSVTGEVRHRVEVPDSDGGTHPQLLRLDDQRVLVAWTESRDGKQTVRLVRMTLEEAP